MMFKAAARQAVSSETVQEFIRALGFDPGDVCDMHVGHLCIEVTTYALDQTGKRYVAGDDVAKNVTSVSVEWPTHHITVPWATDEGTLGASHLPTPGHERREVPHA